MSSFTGPVMSSATVLHSTHRMVMTTWQTQFNNQHQLNKSVAVSWQLAFN
jgi:hypothetical protein